MRWILPCALIGLVLGCGQSTPASVDASTPTAPADPEGAVAVARRVPGVAARLSTPATWTLAPEGFVPARPSGLAVTAPRRAGDPLRVAVPETAGATLDVSVGGSTVEGRPEGGVITYPGALDGDDLLQVVREDRVEELRVLRAPRAKIELRWTLRRGPAVEALRLVDGRVHVVVGKKPVVVSEPLVVLDAAGKEVRPALELVTDAHGGVLTASVDARGLAFPVVVDPGWTRTYDKLNHIREEFLAVPVGDGRVVAFPGWLSSVATPDLYDPVTDRFTKAPAVLSKRKRAGGTRLSSGKILWFGGEFSGDDATYELWDPTTGSAAKKTMAITGVAGDAWAVLPTGKVFSMVLSGTRAQIYDPSTDTWTEVASAPSAHNNPAAVALASGKVLVAGGCCSSAVAEIYDPATNSWSATFNMNGARPDPSLLLLPSGKVLVTGNDTIGGRAELFDPATLKFTKLTAPVDLPIGKTHGTVLADGRALLLVPATKQTLYYTEAGGFVMGSETLQMTRTMPGIAPLPGGRLLVAGGTGGSAGLDESRNTAEVWTDATKAKTCTTTTDCGGGPCVDGYCCDRACTETCYGCKVPGREGFCSPIDAAPPTGPGKTCSPYAKCVGGACGTGCATAAECDSGLACLYGTCASKLAAGKACVADGDCASAHCVDGVCCDTACTEQCNACDVPGKVGTCSNAAGGPPHGTRTTCAPYLCGATGCLTTCTKSTDCAVGSWCSGTSCVTGTKANGSTCGDPRECSSGFCVDGLCCNVACDKPCQACKAGGVCGFVTAGTPDPRKLCVGECASGCGASGCSFKTSTTACGASCVGSTLTNGGRCAGTSEACTGSVTGPCAGGLVCASSAACLDKCAKDADCVSGKCDTATGACAALPVDAGPDGTDAGDDASDATGDAAGDTPVTPDTGSPDAGADLGVAESGAPVVDEKPQLPPGVKTCAKDSECATGHCVEGVCCDTACEEKCHSCALLGSPGKCTLEPVGVDLRQHCGPARTCLGTCDGAGQCIGAGKGSMCARNRCTGPSTGVGPAYCAAPGARCDESAGVTFDCAPYTCAPAFGACLRECVTTADCANGYACDVPSRTCVAIEPASADGGCSTTGVGAGGPGSVAALALLASLTRGRRVRTRASTSPRPR